jgi:hypothetical protein
MEFVLLVSQMFVAASCGFLQGALDFGYIRQAHRKGRVSGMKGSKNQ